MHPKCPPFLCRFSARTWCKFSYFTNSELTLGVKFIFIISLMHTVSDKVRFVQRKLKPEEAFRTKKWMVLAKHLLAQAYIYIYLMLLNSWWFDGFLSRFKGFFIWSRQWYRQFGWPWVRKYWHYIYIYASLHHVNTVRSIIEWKQSRNNHTAKLIYPNRIRTVQYLAVSTHSLEGVGSECLCTY